MRVRLDFRDSTGAARPVGEADLDPLLLADLRRGRGPDQRVTSFAVGGVTYEATWRFDNIVSLIVPSRENAKGWPGFRPAPGSR